LKKRLNNAPHLYRTWESFNCSF